MTEATGTQDLQAGLHRVRCYCDLHRYAQAREAVQRLLATYPQEAKAWCLLARARLGLEDFQGALHAAGRAIALHPDDEWPHRLASIALSFLDRDDEALAAAVESARLGPFAWQTHGRVAAASVKLNMFAQADAAARRATELAPLEARAWVVAADVAAATRGGGDRAAAHYRRALELDPQLDDAHAGLARLHLGRHNFTGARDLAAAASGFATAVRAEPRGKHNRNALETVLRLFLARTSYFLFLVCYLVVRLTAHSDTAAARVAPVVLLAVPAVFAARFVVRLNPSVRTHLLRTLRTGLVAPASGADAAAVLLVIAGAVVPQHDRAPMALFAIVCALIARLALMVEFRRRLPDVAQQPARGRGIAVGCVVGAFAAGGVLIAAGYRTEGGTAAAAVGVALVLIAALGTALLYRSWRRGSREARSAS